MAPCAPWPPPSSRVATSPSATARATPPSTRSAASRSRSRPARSPRSWARRARASRRSCTCWPGSTARPTGTVDIDGTEIGKLDDGDLTRLRRDKIGFVFQAFNLVPVLTAEENIRAPADARRPRRRGGRVDAAARGRRARRPPHPPPRRAVRRPAAARRRGARARLRARGDLRRRADRQPRLDDLGRDPRPPAPRGRRVRPGGRDGHARARRRGDRRPRDLPRRRPDRRRRLRASTPSRSSIG